MNSIPSIVEMVRSEAIEEPSDLTGCKRPVQNFSIQIRLERDDEIPAFGAFLRCEPPCDCNQNTILINVGGCLCPEQAEEDGTPVPVQGEERKRILIETLMHEFGHALERHFLLPVNEEAIEKAVSDWEAQWIRSGQLPSQQAADLRSPNPDLPK